MKKNEIKLLLIVMSFMIINFATAQKIVKKSFSAKENLKINLVSGDCEIKKSGTNKIEIQLSYTYPDDCFEFKFEETDDALKVIEKFEGDCRGESNWEIAVPENVHVKFNSASGNLVLNDVSNGFSGNTASGDFKLNTIKGAVNVNTASGDVDAINVAGDLKLNTASGDVEIQKSTGEIAVTTASGNVKIEGNTQGVKVSTASGDVALTNISGVNKIKTASGEIDATNSTGEFKMATASGDIELDNVELTAESELSAASGNIKIELKKALTHDLTLSTASGDVTLDYNGNDVKGFFEFMAREDKGRIVSPFKFDKEEKVEKGGETYDKKSFTKGLASPKVYLKTSSGTVALEK
jgi:DUF4097 and DUF4098 domain-containing protein YvlB